jgi:tetratricopeptide (TPR) repeat protein
MARVMPHWSDGVPGYGFVLGCRGFSHEENSEFEPAERLGRRAVEINENDIWAGHCVAHVLEAQGRRREGIAWVDEHEEAWKKRGVFAHHMWWHRALHYLELERFDDVMVAYDRQFWAEPSEDNIDIGNASSMLMRLAMLGIDVGGRWGSIAKVCAGRVEGRLRPFNDLHFVMALAMAGRRAEAEAILASMKDFAAAYGDDDNVSLAPIYHDAAIPVAEAILAYAAGDYARTVAIMQEARYGMLPVGGSWAQRDVWLRMLIDAAMKDGRNALARALLAERTAECPTSAPSWKLYATALDRCGAADAARTARDKAAALLAS